MFKALHPTVSIPQSEFCPLGLKSDAAYVDRLQPRFNSSVGILSVGTNFQTSSIIMNTQSFNSSVGILSVGTKRSGIRAFAWVRVSIPQSEFCPLGLESLAPQGLEMSVSIPQSEFCPLGRHGMSSRLPSSKGFQFLSRNSVRWDKASM